LTSGNITTIRADVNESVGRGFDWIHDLKKKTGKKYIPELLALSRDHDPFFIGSPAHIEQGQWFAQMWEQKYKGQTGIHIRRVHYHLQALGDFPNLQGMPYRNTKIDWRHLELACMYARTLGLVPADAFDDHRNGDPYPLNWSMADVRSPEATETYFFWQLPELRLNLSSLDWTLDTPRVDGYSPDDYLDRAYLVELWIEKSTMDDILVPIVNELGIRLVTSSGFQSISNAVKLLQRIREIGKPTRIFYVSDYDKAGRQMPIAVARQIEFWREEYAPDADIKLIVLALTQEQIGKYRLPLSPESDAVELDAIEALVPGELEKIVRAAVAPYLDESIGDELQDAETNARRIVRDEWSRLMGTHKRRLEVLQKKVKTVAKKYEREARNLNKRLARELKPFEKPLAALRADVREQASDFRPNLPERPAQTASEQNEDDCLFDSSRPYLDQLAFYKTAAATKAGKFR